MPTQKTKFLPRNLGRWFVLGLGCLAAFSLVLEFGFVVEPRTERLLERLDVGIALLFGLELFLALVFSRLASLRERWYEYLILLLFLTALGLIRWFGTAQEMQGVLDVLHLKSVTKLYLVLVQVFVLIDVLVRFLRGQQRLLEATLSPERLFVSGFAFLVLSGTALLLLPRASADPDHSIGVLDAFFTATSATCVTGLVVRDTGAAFSGLGQVIILALVQVGGLGIVTFVGFMSVASGRGFSVPQMVALREMVNARSLADVGKHILAIVLLAVTIEIVGAAALWLLAPDTGGSQLEQIWWAVFHSISAFCNAGFALQTTSFEGLRGDVGVNVTLMLLILLGGLGAPVVRDLLGWVSARCSPRRQEPSERLAAGRAKPRLRAQTRISLFVTGMLILGGFGAFLLTEWSSTLRGFSPSERVLVSFFQSVTPRTAGFNTVPMDDLTDAALVLLVVLMVIGASPVSTGGGIKTVAFGVLALTLRSIATGKSAEAFHRRIPAGIVRASISIFVTYVVMAVSITFLLSLTDPAIALRDKVFETVSALSTVGLSTGITAELSAGGKLVLCLAMFAGRVGPLTLTMTIFRSHARARYEYPEEAMVLG